MELKKAKAFTAAPAGASNMSILEAEGTEISSNQK